VLLVHDSLEEGGDGGSDELAESTLEGSSLVGTDPLLPGGVVVPVSPELVHHLLLGNAELCTVGDGEFLEGERPLVKSRSKGDSSLRFS